jgi:hypothetical protein
VPRALERLDVEHVIDDLIRDNRRHAQRITACAMKRTAVP